MSKYKKLIRRILPRKFVTALRFYKIFNHGFGHSNTKDAFSVDASGNPIPWLTYPCIEFIETLNLSHCRVFEYGSGASTLYWAKKTQSVIAVERDRDWFQKLKPLMPPNVELIHCNNEDKYPYTISNFSGEFDIIIIDGAVRYPSLFAAEPKLSADGVIIFDNIEWYPNSAKYLRDLGYVQIDFCGFPPINAFTSCTSIFFKDSALLKNKEVKDRWHPIGSKYLIPYDDVPLDQIKNLNREQ